MNLLSLLIDLVVVGVKEAWNDRDREAENLRRKVAFERDKPSIRSQYATWAHERGLRSGKSQDLASGTVAGRYIRFDMALAGESERKPTIDVRVPLDVSEAIRVERAHEPASVIERRVRTVIGKVELLETIWLSEDGLRLVFEPRVHPDVFDAALDALDECLRSSPYH
jgi:hypothetical protein